MEIKRIIFDLDNTLIEWKEEYWNSINKTFEELNLPYADCTISKVKHAVDVYEDGRMETYNKELMHKTIEHELGYELPKEFMDVWLKHLGNCVPEKIDEAEIETLEYLKNKYDLVILSNWFEFSQNERLKNAGLYKFFTSTYMTEGFPMKPNKEAFEIAKGEFELPECIMVGDNYRVDIQGAIEAGMKGILISKNKNIKLNSKLIAIIDDISELEKIL